MMFKGPFCGPFFVKSGSYDKPRFSGILKAFLQSSDKARNSSTRDIAVGDRQRSSNDKDRSDRTVLTER